MSWRGADAAHLTGSLTPGSVRPASQAATRVTHVFRPDAVRAPDDRSARGPIPALPFAVGSMRGRSVHSQLEFDQDRLTLHAKQAWYDLRKSPQFEMP